MWVNPNNTGWTWVDQQSDGKSNPTPSLTSTTAPSRISVPPPSKAMPPEVSVPPRRVPARDPVPPLLGLPSGVTGVTQCHEGVTQCHEARDCSVCTTGLCVTNSNEF